MLASNPLISVVLSSHQRSFPLQWMGTVRENHNRQNSGINRLWGPQCQWVWLQHSSCIYCSENMIVSPRNSRINKIWTMTTSVDTLIRKVEKSPWWQGTHLEKDLEVTGDFWERMNKPVSKMSPLIGYPVQSGHFWNYRHTNNNNREWIQQVGFS